MADQIALKTETPNIDSHSVSSVSAKFRDRSTSAASTPSSIRYRVDCLTNHRNVINWTSVSPASSATITIPGAYNAIIDDENNYETRQLLVEIDTGLSSQVRQATTWKIKNNRHYEPSATFEDDLQIEAYHPITAAETAAGVTPSSYQYEPGDVRRYGADPTGSDDCVAAFNAAIDVAAAEAGGGGLVYAPTGKYLFSSTVSIDVDRVKIRGDGPRATEFWFAPTANDTLFAFGTGAVQQEQAGISECAILSGDSTYEKVAIETSDGSNFTIENVEIGGTVVVDSVNTWSGGAGGSIGLRVLGRETLLSRNLYIVADRPVYLGVNPNLSTIHTDHFNFHNLYLIGNDYPLVEVAPGVNIMDLSFTGSQPWVRGTSGFKWAGTTTTQSNGLVFENVGTEQFTGTTEFAFDIQANATGVLRNLTIHGAEVESTRHGVKCRNVQRIEIIQSTFSGSSGITNLDITFLSTTKLSLRNSLFNSGSTITLTNAILQWGTSFGTGVSSISQTAEYTDHASAIIQNQRPMLGQNTTKTWNYQGTLANNATLATPVRQSNTTVANIEVAAYSATGPILCHGHASWFVNGTTVKNWGSANFVVAAAGVELRVLDGGSGLDVINVLGQTVTIRIAINYE